MNPLGKQTRANNFSILRILFAILVILSHSFELIDGNRSHEIMTRFFGTISFAMLAVDGFFIVSGYLITKSYLSSEPVSYLFKRILRIYPGFIIAFIVSIVFCEYFSSYIMAMPKKEVFDNILNLVFLNAPVIKNGYPGFFYPEPNGAMWTISYEFHCYLAIMLLGFLGLFKKKKLLLVITTVAIAAYLIHPAKYVPFAPPDTSSAIRASTAFGSRIINKLKFLTLESSIQDLRFLGIFLAGSCFYIFRDVIPYRPSFAVIAAMLLVGCLFSKHLAEPSLAVFGGYIIFWFALHTEALSISKFFNRTDLSYGIYLYAWPIQKALISQLPHITAYALFILASILSMIMAYFSWTFIEKPLLNLKSHYLPQNPKLARMAEST